MTNHVTDTNVGKMTLQEAMVIIENGRVWEDENGCLHNYPLEDEYIEASDMAIEALQFQQSLVRCGECKHYICDNPDSPDDAHIMICDLCSVGGYRVLAESDGYCHLGERRNEE